MENRLCLNSVPSFENEGIKIRVVWRNCWGTPEQEPDIRVNAFGCPLMEVLTDKKKGKEMWIYCEDKNEVEPLRKWIEGINWLEKAFGGEKAEDRAGSPNLSKWKFERYIKEEYYKCLD